MPPTAESGSMAGILPFRTHFSTLANGLTVCVVPLPTPRLASYWTIVRTGSRDEYEPGRTGFAHFFEHMMFRGTEKYPADRYQEALTRLGADSNAYTTDDLTAFHMSCSPDDLATAFEIESDRFMNLDYPESAFRTEAGAVYGEYRKDKTDPLFTLYESVRETAFERHTYGHTTMGYEADIAAMPTLYAYSREFFRRYYRPENAILLVTGDVEPDRVRALAESYHGEWSPGYEAPAVPAEPEQNEERHVDVAYPGQTLPLIMQGYKIGRFDPADRIRVAADLLAELVFGETSELYRRLVLRDQSVEFLVADAGMNRDPSLLDVYCRVKGPDRIEPVSAAIDAANAHFREHEVDAAALDALKSRLRYGFLLGLETPDDVAGAFARPLALAGDLDDFEALYAAYARVTPADIRDAANAILVAGHRTHGVLRGRDG